MRTDTSHLDLGSHAALPWDARYDGMLCLTSRAVNSPMSERGNDNVTQPRYESAQQPEYNFARSQVDWSLLQAQMREAVENSIVSF